VYAQYHEIDLSVAKGNATVISDFIDGLDNFDFISKKSSYDYFFTYKYTLENNIGFGLTLGYFTDEGYLGYIVGHEEDDIGLGTYKRTSYIISPEITFPYVVEYGFKFYSIVALGIRLSDTKIDYVPNPKYLESSSQIAPAIQLTPLAFRFGTRVGGILELGWGHKGMINLGLFCKI